MKRNRILIAFFWFSLLWWNCAGSRGPLSGAPSEQGLENWPVRYKAEFHTIKTWKSKANLSIETPEFASTFTAGFVYAAPDSLLLKAEGPFGIDLGEIFIGKTRFILHNQFHNQFLCGDLREEYYNTFLQTRFTLQQLKNALLGYIPVPDDIKLTDPRHGIFLARVENTQWRFEVDPKSGRLKKFEIREEGMPVLQQTFERYRKINGHTVATLTRLTIPGARQQISVHHRNIRLDEPLNPEEYRIVIGTKATQLIINE
ncbi:MAG: hypothetical protein Kow0037_22230 [Calditrichia bacterium]